MKQIITKIRNLFSKPKQKESKEQVKEMLEWLEVWAN